MLSVAVGVVTDVVLELGDVQEGEAPVDGCAGRRTFCTILSLSAKGEMRIVSVFMFVTDGKIPLVNNAV